MKRWIVLTKNNGSPYYLHVESLNGMDVYIDYDTKEYRTTLYVWPCLVSVKETPEKIIKMIQDQEPKF